MTDEDNQPYLGDAQIELIKNKPSEFVKRIIGIDPFDYQMDILDCDESRLAFVSGRQVGKSKSAAWFSLHFALTHPNSTTLITAPTRRQSSELFSQVTKEMNQSEINDDQWGVSRKTRTVLEFENGSRIVCLPAGDDGSNIRGYTADLIIVDEAAFINDEVFYQALMPMLATTNGKLILLSTPFGASGFLYDAFHGSLKEPYYTKQVATYRNPMVDDDFIMTQQQQLSSTDFKQEILGKFVESANSFLPEDVITNCIKSTNSRTSKRCALGVDLARHGEDKSVFISIDADGNVFSIESHQDKALTEAIGRVKFLHDQFNYGKICVDETSLGGGVVDVLKEDINSQVVRGVTFTNKSKVELYNNLKASMEASEISLPNHSDLKKELLDLEVSFTKSKKMKISHPQGGTDDFPDALALAVKAQSDFAAPRQSKPFKIDVDSDGYKY